MSFSRFKSFVSSKIDAYVNQDSQNNNQNNNNNHSDPNSPTQAGTKGVNKLALANVSLVPITPRIFLYQPSLTPSLSIVASQALSTVSDVLFSNLLPATLSNNDNNNEDGSTNPANANPITTKLNQLAQQHPIISLQLLIAQMDYIDQAFENKNGEQTRCLLINTAENQPLTAPRLSQASDRRDDISLLQNHSVIRLSTPNVPIYPLKTLYTVLYSTLKWLSEEEGPIIFYPSNMPNSPPDLTRAVMLISAMLPFIRELITPPHIQAQQFQRDMSLSPTKTLTAYENLKKRGPIECYKSLLQKLNPGGSIQQSQKMGIVLCASQLRLLNYIAAIWKGRLPFIIRGLPMGVDGVIQENAMIAEKQLQRDLYEKISYLYKQTSNVIVIDKIIITGIPTMRPPVQLHGNTGANNKDNSANGEFISREKWTDKQREQANKFSCRPFLQIYQVIDPDNALNVPFLSTAPNSLLNIPTHNQMVQILGLDKKINDNNFSLESSDDDNKDDNDNTNDDNDNEQQGESQQKPKAAKLQQKPYTIDDIYLHANDMENAYMIQSDQNEENHNIAIKCGLISTSIPIIDATLPLNRSSDDEQDGEEGDSSGNNDNNENQGGKAQQQQQQQQPTYNLGPYTLTPKSTVGSQNNFIADRTSTVRATTTIPQYIAHSQGGKGSQPIDGNTSSLLDPNQQSLLPTLEQQVVWSNAQYDHIVQSSPALQHDLTEEDEGALPQNAQDLIQSPPNKAQPQWVSRLDQSMLLFPLSVPARGHVMLRLMHIQSQQQRVCLGRVNLFCGFLSPGLIRLTPGDIDDCHPDIESIDIVIRGISEPIDINLKKEQEQQPEENKTTEHQLPENFPSDLHIQSIYHTSIWDGIGSEQNQLDLGYLSQKHSQIKKVIADNQDKLHKQYIIQQQIAEENRLKKVEEMKRIAAENAIKQQQAQEEYNRKVAAAEEQKKKDAEQLKLKQQQQQQQAQQQQNQPPQQQQQQKPQQQPQQQTGGWRSMFSNFVNSVTTTEQPSQQQQQPKQRPKQSPQQQKPVQQQQQPSPKPVQKPPQQETAPTTSAIADDSSDDDLEVVFQSSPRVVQPEPQPTLTTTAATTTTTTTAAPVQPVLSQQQPTTPVKPTQQQQPTPASPTQANNVDDLYQMFEADATGPKDITIPANQSNNNNNQQPINSIDDIPFGDDDDFLFNPDGHAIDDNTISNTNNNTGDDLDNDDLFKQLQMELGLDEDDLLSGNDSFLFGDLNDNDDDNLNFTSPNVTKDQPPAIQEEVKPSTPVKNTPAPVVVEEEKKAPTDLLSIETPLPTPTPTEPSTPSAINNTSTENNNEDGEDNGDDDNNNNEPSSPTVGEEGQAKVKKTKTVVKKVVKKVRIVKKGANSDAPAAE